MDFKDALNAIIKKNRREILNDNFRVRSILCDYVGFSLYQTKLINIFCAIYKEYDLVKIFKNKGLIEGRRYLKAVYPKFVSICTYIDFKEAINPISEIICPDEYLKYNNTKQPQKENKVVIVKNASQKVLPTLTNQIVLPKPLNSIKGINIITEVESVKIDYFDDKGKPYKDVKLYYKSKNYNPISTNSYHIKSDILYINTKKTEGDIVIGLPLNMKLDSLDIKTNRTNIDINSLIKIDKTNIITESGNVEAQVSGNNLNVKTKSGMIGLNINTINTNCDSKEGGIIFCVFPIQKKKMNVNLSSSSGNIIGVLGFKARMKITGLFNKRGLVTSKVKEDKCVINYRLYAQNGKISIK